MKLPLQFIKELLSATDAVNFYKKEVDGWNREYHFKSEQVLEAIEMETTWTPETNRIPFGLLTKEEQAALKAAQHGWEVYISDQWETSKAPAWCGLSVYRAKPAPKRIVTWHNVYIEELEKRLKASEERSDVLEELVMDVVHDLRNGVSGSKIDSRICKVMKKLEWGE